MAKTSFQGGNTNLKIHVSGTNTASLSGIPEATDVTVDLNNNSIDVSKLGQTAIERLAGRNDFSVSWDMNLDLSLTRHQQLLDRTKDDQAVLVRVDPSGSGSSGQRLDAVCKVDTASLSVPGDSQNTTSLTANNSDGTDWKRA